MAIGVVPGRALPRGGDLEAAVKANYLYKFTPFVTWPASAFASATSPFTLCVLGPDPFGEVLDSVVRNQQVAGRPVVVRRLARPDSVQACQLVYLGAARGWGEAAEAAQAVARRPVLVVSEDSPGAPAGIIRFVPFQGRVRFAVDAAAAQIAGLTISSKLLALAVTRPDNRP
jgi:hypothetical protein